MRRFLVLFALCFFSSVTFAKPAETSNVVLKSETRATLSSELAGKINKIAVQEGDQFKKGDDLVVFDCTAHEAQLAKAKALLSAKQSAHNSNSRMYSQKAISHVEFQESKAALAEAQSEVKIKQHVVEQCYIRAPFDGTLVKRHIYSHESVRQGQPLVEILDNHDLTIELIVPSVWLAWLKVGEPFKLFVEETKKEYDAHVTKILPKIDSVSQSVRLLAKLKKQNGELISGMSGRARFHLRNVP